MKTLSELKTQQGKGQGYGYPKQKSGGTDVCVCPKCGETTKHKRGTPCNKTKCPKCGAPMQGSAQTDD